MTCSNLDITPYFSIDFDYNTKDILEVRTEFSIMFEHGSKILSKTFSLAELKKPVTLAEHVKALFDLSAECEKFDIKVHFDKSQELEDSEGVTIHPIGFEKDGLRILVELVEAQINSPEIIASCILDELSNQDSQPN